MNQIIHPKWLIGLTEFNVVKNHMLEERFVCLLPVEATHLS